MIIKNLTIGHKSKYRIKQLVKYVLLDNNPSKNPFEDFVILQNIHTIDPSKIHKEFLAQDKFRKERLNGICYHHTILSFSPLDKKVITKDILEDLAKEFIKIRGANEALVLCKHHEEKDHHHLHLLISATKYKSAESLRLDNEQYKNVQESIELYQKQKYPQLEHSIVYLDKQPKQKNKSFSDKRKRFQKEFQMKARMNENTQTKKEYLKERVSNILNQSKNPKEFLLAIKAEAEFELYAYRGKITGLLYEGKKYRFTTFGISKEDLQSLRNENNRMQSIRKNRSQTEGLTRGS
ncbi:MAG: relaxase/mobilization nuclease domain-containing protein [Flavobacteriales bacterium]